RWSNLSSADRPSARSRGQQCGSMTPAILDATWAPVRLYLRLNGARTSITRCPNVCRFSDADSDEPSARAGGRRLKSASKARNRGRWGTVGAAGLYGDLARGVGLGKVGSKRPAPI